MLVTEQNLGFSVGREIFSFNWNLQEIQGALEDSRSVPNVTTPSKVTLNPAC